MPLDPLKSAAAIPLGLNNYREVQTAALGVLAKRQSILAANIANADTPQYKAVDFDFANALHSALVNADSKPVELNRTATNHLAAHGNPTPIAEPLLYHQPFQASVDGNTVELDVERAKFSENALRYEFAVQQVGGDFKDMLKLLTSLT